MRLQLIGVLGLLALASGCTPSARPADGGTGGGGGGGGSAGGIGGGTGGGLADPCPALAADAGAFDGYTSLLGCLRSTASAAQKDQAIAGFVSAVDARDGFPIVNGTQLVFVYVRDAKYDLAVGGGPTEHFDPALRNEPLRVAGEFGAWAPSAMAKEDRDFFHAVVPVAEPAAGKRWRYKFVAADGAGADAWFSDPLSRRFDYDANGRISIVRGGATQGHLEWLRSVHATQLNVDRPISFYVPRGYDTGTQRYPVLYMHDGNNLFDPDQPSAAPTSWEADAEAEAEIGAGRAREFIIVAVPNDANRMGEYTQGPDVVSGMTVGGDGDKYADFLVRELKPLVDAKYRTLPARESTGILGSSLGGLISYYIGLKYPGTFKFVGGMSSTFDWGTPNMIELFQQATGLSTRDQVFYLDSGGGPPATGPCPFDGPNDGADNYCETLSMKTVLETAGLTTYPADANSAPLMPANVDIMHWWEPNALHTEASWHARIHRVYWLFFRP